jgi:predicted  nucleic acid-binding Zn-ribbon protein
MSEHDERAQDLEHDLDEMDERSDRLEDEIADAREDWERKKGDASVPGAPPDSDDED